MTWYRHALGYRVTAELRPTGSEDLPFRREDGELHIDLDGRPLESIERIEVGWPSQKLADLTLIDTPGLASADERNSARTTHALLDRGAEGPGEADAVLYLMRHLHRSDSQFLEAFMDRSIAHASPVNAIVVLSRADEIGAARPDALDSARSIATRYAANPQVRELASGVVPVAGLIAETGATLRQEQFEWLREVARLDEARRADLLRSVDRFRDPDLSPLAEEIREELLDRLGLFGLRLAVRLLADGEVRTATELSGALLEHSGIRELQRVLAEQYTARAQALKARSALAALRVVGEELDRRGVRDAADLVQAVDRLEASSQALALLRLLHLVLSGQIALETDERAEIDRLCGSGSPARARRPGDRRASGRGPGGGHRGHRAVAVEGGQPHERPPDDRGGRDRQPRVRGDPRQGGRVTVGPALAARDVADGGVDATRVLSADVAPTRPGHPVLGRSRPSSNGRGRWMDNVGASAPNMQAERERRMALNPLVTRLLRALGASLLLLVLGGAGVAAAADIGTEDFGATTGGAAITGSKPESKLWYNDGTWWASMWRTSPAGFYIYRLDTDTWNPTTTALDPRSGTRADTLWDGTKLYVASQALGEDGGAVGSGTDFETRLYRYSYDRTYHVYTRDSGFPVSMRSGIQSEPWSSPRTRPGRSGPPGPSRAASARTPCTRATRSTATTRPGPPPEALPAGPTRTPTGIDDISSIIAFTVSGQHRIGVFWSNQIQNKDYFAWQADGGPDDDWTFETAVAPTSGDPDPADDHMNLKTDSSGKVYVVTKTSNNVSTQPLIQLLDRTPAGVLDGAPGRRPSPTATPGRSSSSIRADLAPRLHDRAPHRRRRWPGAAASSSRRVSDLRRRSPSPLVPGRRDP